MSYPLGTYNWLRRSAVQELSHIWKQHFSTSYTSQVSCLILYWFCTTQAGEPWVAFLKTFPETETSAALVTRHTPISPTYHVQLKMGNMCFRTTSPTLVITKQFLVHKCDLSWCQSFCHLLALKWSFRHKNDLKMQFGAFVGYFLGS